MSKYIDADKLKAEIERLRVFFEYNGKTPDERAWRCLGELLSFIDSLQQEQSQVADSSKTLDGLMEEVQRYYSDNFAYISSDQPTLSILTNIARHFAEWQKEQMMKEAVETELYWDGDFLAIDLNMAALGYSERDKVRVIVLKAEEKKK